MMTGDLYPSGAIPDQLALPGLGALLGTCEAKIPAGPFFSLCNQPAVAVHEYACIHEHVRRRATCAAHEPEPGKVGCWACLQAGHDCDMTARPVTCDGPL